MKLSSKTLFRSMVLAGFAILAITEFTNCGTYSDPGNTTQDSVATTCTTPSCITPTLNNLSVTVNLGGGSDFSVPANLTEFDLGGDCNEGGYPYNTITWELDLNGVMVRNSSMLGMAGNSNVNSVCVNGRFLLYLNLQAISQDTVDRTGLSTGTGARSPYDLWVTVYGQMIQSGPMAGNQLTGRYHVSLVPIM